jgi:hypothetical protein
VTIYKAETWAQIKADISTQTAAEMRLAITEEKMEQLSWYSDGLWAPTARVQFPVQIRFFFSL